MRKLSLLFLGLLFAFSGGAQPNKTRITVSLPEGWTKVAGSVLEHQYLKNGASFMIKEETALNGKSMEDAIPVVKQQMTKFFKEIEFAPVERMKIDGRDARSVTFIYSVKVGNTVLKMKMQSIYVMVGGKCQNISFGTFADQFSAITGEIQQILRGIRFS